MTAQFQDLDLQDIQFLIETDDDAAMEHDHDATTIVVASTIDAQTAFPLINAILPFEACLYHQILPLYINGNALYLGMVDLEDMAALDYARQILVFLKYQIITQTISTAAHHQVLSAYLSDQSRRRSQLAIAAPKVPEPEHMTPEYMTPAELAAANEETAVLELASPSGLPTTFRLPDQAALTQWPIALHDACRPAARLFQPPPRSSKPAPAPLPGAALPELLITAPPVNVSLRSLAPQALLDALLLRVIQSGVGRLFLVRQHGTGRVLWTESGVIKATLENLDLNHLAGTIVALKHLMHCPIGPVLEGPIEVEIERLYQRQRVLLRLRLTPKETGEEATLQILRGAALKFYQQQQIKTLSRDTMSIVAQLRQKMTELQKRTCTAHDNRHEDRQTLNQDSDVRPQLDEAIQDIENQLTQIKQLRATWSN